VLSGLGSRPKGFEKGKKSRVGRSSPPGRDPWRSTDGGRGERRGVCVGSPWSLSLSLSLSLKLVDPDLRLRFGPLEHGRTHWHLPN
jgi:hypothetical protein